MSLYYNRQHVDKMRLRPRYKIYRQYMILYNIMYHKDDRTKTQFNIYHFVLTK